MLKEVDKDDHKSAASPEAPVIALERRLLGTLMVDNAAVDSIAIDPSSFLEPLHREIYVTMQRLVADGRPATAETVSLVLATSPAISTRTTNAAYIASLLGAATTSDRARGYAALIADAAAKREAVAIATTLADVAANPGSKASEIINAAVSKLEALGAKSTSATAPLITIGSAALSVVDDLGKASAHGKVIFDYHDLERGHGYAMPSQHWVLSGTTGGFKTASAMQMAINAARHRANVVVISQEMKAKEVGVRALSTISHMCGDGIPGIEIKGVRPDEPRADVLRRAAERLASLPIHIADQTGMSVSDIAAYLRRREREQGTKCDLLITDYLGLLAAEDRYRGNKVAETGEISRALKLLAGRFDLVSLCLHQLSRAPNARDNKRPTKHDLRDSGAIENDADVILMNFREASFIERDLDALEAATEPEAIARRDALMSRLSEVRNLIEIGVVKNRHGPEGLVKMHVAPPYYYIASMDRRDPTVPF